MRSSPKLLTLVLFCFIISSFAHLEHVSSSPSQAPLASDGPHISVSPASSPALAPSLTSTPTTVDTPSSLKEWCNFTDYPDLCVSAIGPYLKGKPDLFNALDIAIKAAVETTKTAILAGTKIANSPLMPWELASILQDSLDSFNDALDNYKQAQDALPLRDWGTVNTMLSGAISDFGDCEDQLGNKNVPVLIEFSEKLTKMTSNCLALSALFDPPPGY